VVILIKNADFVIRDAGRIERHVDILIKDNRIAQVGKCDYNWCTDNAALEIIDASGKAVIPGLINAHTHLYQNLLKGRQDNLPLVEWCRDVTFPLCELIEKERSQNKDESLGYYWSMMAAMEMLKNGTTTCLNLDMTLDSVFKAWREIGIRGIGAITCADMWISDSLKLDFEKIKEKILGFIDRWYRKPDEAPLISVMFGPSAPFVCSEKLLSWIREEASRKKIAIHIHVAETQYEVQLMIRERGLRPLEYLDKIGFLGSDVSAAHCIHLHPNELHVIKEKNVIPVYNPKSNMKLGSGIAPIAKMLSLGINVGLGNDGSASNDNLDLFEEMRAAALLQKVAAGDPSVITARDVFRMATEGGALACGIDAGTIDQGKLADIVLIDLNKPHLLPVTDIVNTIVYCARGSDVNSVLVNGRVLVRQGQLVSLSEEEVINETMSVVKHKMGI